MHNLTFITLSMVMRPHTLEFFTVSERGPGRDKTFLSSPKCPRPAVGFTQPTIQWVLGFFRGDKAVGA